MAELVNSGNVRASAAVGGIQLDLAPDAVITESGSNSNGSWVCFSDGTQICWGPAGTVSGLTTTTTTVQGLTVYAYTLAWTFPQAFAAAPSLGAPNPRVLLSGTTRISHLNSGYSSGANTTSVNLRIMCLADFNQVEDPYPIAIGRWK